MSLMLKLLATIALLSSFLIADEQNKKIEDFLKQLYSSNPNIKSLKIKITDRVDVKEHPGWSAYIVDFDAILAKENRQASQKMVWFSDGDVISKEIFSVNDKKDLKDFVSLTFKSEYYKKENLIYGNENAKHKVAIFSDPLCPFCKKFVPEALEYMKKYPNKFAVYYYHLPLEALHPASVELSQAAIALELQGRKDVVLDLYKINIDPKERVNEVILGTFNKAMNSKITVADLMSAEVTKHFQSDLEIADKNMVNGTPTMFFDGVLDKTKNKYKEVK
ncbi:MAG: thiol:disulfide interchange protein DsbC [Campylobacterota bacterium]|nr:thiol:disulfide interchange protein DsbC [Campylobacterota bacterium]